VVTWTGISKWSHGLVSQSGHMDWYLKVVTWTGILMLS
jgi:hypothetical protein